MTTTVSALDDTAPRAGVRALRARGSDLAFLPRALGGDELGHRAFAAAVSAVARHCPATGRHWVEHTGGALDLLALSAPVPKRRYADALASGAGFGAYCLATTGRTARAEPAPGGHVLSGIADPFPGGEPADHVLVEALVDGVPVYFGISSGNRPEEAFVPADQRCPGHGPPSHLVLGSAFLALTGAESVAAEMVGHIRGGAVTVTGAPLARQAWLREAVAEAQARVEATRLHTWYTAWLADTDPAAFPGAAAVTLPLATTLAEDLLALADQAGAAAGHQSAPGARSAAEAARPIRRHRGAELLGDGRALETTGPPPRS